MKTVRVECIRVSNAISRLSCTIRRACESAESNCTRQIDESKIVEMHEKPRSPNTQSIPKDTQYH